MRTPLDPLPGMSSAEHEAINAYVAELVAAAPAPTPELLARLRPILASTYDKQTDAA